MRINSPKLNVMYKACMKASKALIRDFGEIEKLQVSSKGPGDFVSSADKRTEKIIIEELLKAQPDYCILSEETGIINEKNKTNRWIIDPIDGTSNFLNGIPHFSISIGYEEDNKLKTGLIYDPIKNELFFAETGSGSFLNNSRIRVSKKNKLINSLVGTGGPKSDSKNKEEILNEFSFVSKHVNIPLRKYGSASLDLANVACGRFEGYWQRELNLWDVAAGIVIVKEAGGFVDFMENNVMQSKKLSLIASNSLIHKELIDLIFKKNIEKI